MTTKNNEFKEALEKVNCCIATIVFECSMTPDEGLYADSLYYRCREYMRVHDEAKFGESKNSRK